MYMTSTGDLHLTKTEKEILSDLMEVAKLDYGETNYIKIIENLQDHLETMILYEEEKEQ